MKPHTTGRKAAKPRQPIKHTKTFSACWTCRKRHVKCDELRPECARCVKGGFECQGYGIKLVWIDPDTQEREQNIRRAIGAPAIYDHDSSFMRVDVQHALETLENCSTDAKGLTFGPFAVFAIRNFASAARHWSNETAGGVEARQNSAYDDASEAPTEYTFDGDEDMELIVSPSINGALTVGGRRGSASTISSDAFQEWVGFSSSPLQSRHLDLLPRPAEQRELIHHWTSFVCWHLVPVDRPDNPFRSVFTPMALAGLNSPSNRSSGQVALFHALCATSAFSRAHLLQGEANALTLATKHYHLAILHLRHSLANIKDTLDLDSQRGAILATITMFSTMDMITGRASEWRTHLQGGSSWLSTIEGDVWDRDKSSSMVFQGYLAIAALCNISLPSSFDVESENFLDERYYVLDRFFGLTRPILKHILKMNAMIKRISSTDPNPSAEVLDGLETQLYMQTPETLDLSSLDPLAQTMARHHAYVFYYASLIHFQRTLRRRPSTEVKDMVEIAVGHLENIEELGGDAVGCTLVWPPFIVACECLSEKLQQRMLAWYMVKRRHGFRNLEISKDIAQELWRRRSIQSEDVDIQWQDVLQDLDMDIVLA